MALKHTQRVTGWEGEERKLPILVAERNQITLLSPLGEGDGDPAEEEINWRSQYQLSYPSLSEHLQTDTGVLSRMWQPASKVGYSSP